MDFTLNEQQTELQRVARDFAQKEMVSVALEMEEKNIPLHQKIG